MIKKQKLNIFICCFLWLFSIINFSYTPKFNANKYTNYTYAKINEDNVYLFKTNISTFLTNAYFEIPKTYFVMLLSNIDDTFYKVQYKDIVGFVLKSKVTPVVETPQTPYLNLVTFRIYAQDGLNMLSSPFSSTSTNIITTLPTLPTLNYYGKIEADELVSGRGNIWFYSKFDDTASSNTKTNNLVNLSTSAYTGYVYAGFCDSLTTIQPNTEITTPTTNPFYEENNEYLYSLINLSPLLKAIIVICVCAPCLILIILLFKPFKIQQKLIKNKKHKKEQKDKIINKIEKVIEEDNTI